MKKAQQVKEAHVASIARLDFRPFSNVQVCTTSSLNTTPMHSNASRKQMDLVGILSSGTNHTTYTATTLEQHPPLDRYMQNRTLAAREKQHPAPVVHPVTLL